MGPARSIATIRSPTASLTVVREFPAAPAAASTVKKRFSTTRRSKQSTFPRIRDRERDRKRYEGCFQGPCPSCRLRRWALVTHRLSEPLLVGLCPVQKPTGYRRIRFSSRSAHDRCPRVAACRLIPRRRIGQDQAVAG